MPNTQCPDYMSHAQNAEDTLFPDGAPATLTDEQSSEVDKLAEAEYRVCEGH